MSSPFTQTLNSSDVLKSIQEQNNSFFWSSDSPGMWQGKSADYQSGAYIGIMLFTNMQKINWKTKRILSISFNFNFTRSGKFNLYECNDLVELSSGKTGADFIGSSIGNFSAVSGTNQIILSDELNSEVFKKIVQYLQSANQVQNICLYDDTQTDKLYRMTTITITIEYETAGSLFYGINGEWKRCLVYYGNNGRWQQVIPYYGENNAWKQLGGG